jgi:hypothetical protein
VTDYQKFALTGGRYSSRGSKTGFSLALEARTA